MTHEEGLPRFWLRYPSLHTLWGCYMAICRIQPIVTPVSIDLQISAGIQRIACRLRIGFAPPMQAYSALGLVSANERFSHAG